MIHNLDTLACSCFEGRQRILNEESQPQSALFVFPYMHPPCPYELCEQQQMMIGAEKLEEVITPMTLLSTIAKRTAFTVPSTSTFDVQRCGSNPLDNVHEAEPTEG